MEEIKAGYENVRLQDGDGNKITSTGGALSVSATIAEEALAADGGALPAKVKVIGGYDGTNVQVIKTDANGKIQIDSGISSTIDSANSSSVSLGNGGVFTGSFVEITGYASIQVGVYSDVNSATNGLVIQFSKDGSNIHHTHTYSYLASSNGIGYLFSPEFRYYRIVYTNGGVAQTSFQLISILRSTALFPSQYRISTPVTDETQALMTKSTIVGQTTGGGGGYVAVKVNPSGALTVESTVSSSALPTGAATESTLQSIDTHLFELDSAIVLDKAIYTIGGGRVVVGGYVFDDVADAPALSENSAAAARININRSQVGVIEDASTRGRYATVTASNALKVDGSAVTQPVSFASMPLPTGAATESTLQGVATESTLQAVATEATLQSVDGQLLGIGVNVGLINGEVSSIEAKTPALGQAPMANSTPVVIASNQSAIPVNPSSLSVVDLLDANILDTSSTNIPGSTASPVQVVASLAAAVKRLQLLDTTGAFVGVYTGAAASEVLQFVMGPGSDQTIEHSIPSGTRISLKRLDSTTAVSSGIVAINFLG